MINREVGETKHSAMLMRVAATLPVAQAPAFRNNGYSLAVEFALVRGPSRQEKHAGTFSDYIHQEAECSALAFVTCH